ncbi:hypothetical protein A8709_29860 [Paenibacillus pectinilyticus]|uniref:beta-mannosidase n=1 Tax=Paenibacillus pectinilyticus TaxID=512399 RepID=A0A1C0ZVC5_9BACL|nr:glycoside hydrolase family 2 [Paenibacillus pectinilyticus]OCT12062.1 hypothetical protein A8709_29860 [Paenibacillus pectinilyticus]
MTNELCLDGQWKLFYFPQGERHIHYPDELSRLQIPWIHASVPGNVELDLVRDGLLPEPFVGTNINELRPFELYEWWYSLEFTVPSTMEGKRTELLFMGVDCYATYWLNGEEIGSSDNMFIEVKLATTNSLIQHGVNKLFVRLRSPIIEAMERSTDAICYGPITNGEQLFVRKAAHSFGWDIMPRAVSAGIWRSVSLVVCEDHALTDLYFYTLSVDKNLQAAQIGLFYRVATDPAYFYHGLEIRVTGKSGASEFQMSKPVLFHVGNLTISLENPHLWWPNGYGESPLYEVTTELIHQGCVLASRTERVGIRHVQFIRTETTTAESGGEFLFKINHTPIMCKGSNWVPMDAFHSRDVSRYERALQLFCETGCNMVRCWGGNVYEDHAFFNFCDSHGLMVWQDFAMACAVYPQTPEFSEAMRSEASSVVRKLRNHPSLVLWCGDNECDEAYQWFGLPDPNVNRITRTVLPQVIQQYDPHRAYLPSSPYLSPEVIQSGNMNLAPERHLWGPRDYYKSSFYKTSTDHFISEIGYHGCPNLSSIQTFIEPEYLWPFDSQNEQWITHATEVSGSQGHNATRIQLMANQIKELFGAIPESMEDFILASQISQAEAKKFFIETARLKKWRKTGIIWWNMIDGWPQFSDSVVDYYYGKKLAFHYIKRVQLPVCIMIDEPANWHVRVAAGNDSREFVAGTFRIWEADSNEALLEGKFDVEANGTSELGQIPISHAKQQLFLMEWNIDGHTYGNHYLLGFPAFSLDTYKRWLPQIAAITNDFQADAIGR